MAIVFGEKFYGEVERIPGVSYVSTMFAHIYYIPLWPTRSYLVSEGSEDIDTFHGVPIRMSFKSVVIGYLRGWLGAAAVLSTLATALVASRYFAAQQSQAISVGIYLATFGGTIGLVRYILLTSTRRFITAQAILIGLTVAWWAAAVAPRSSLPGGASDPIVQIWPATFFGNLALLVFSLTRLCIHMRNPPAEISGQKGDATSSNSLETSVR